MALHEALAPLAAPRPSSCCALLGKPGTGLEALEEQGWRLWTGGRPSRSSSTHLSACAGEGFGFWPRCRSCLGDESLPVAFLSREPGGREQKHIPSFSCLSPRHRSPPSCSDCAKIIIKKKAKSSSSSWKKLGVFTPGGAEKPGRAEPHHQLHTAPSTGLPHPPAAGTRLLHGTVCLQSCCLCPGRSQGVLAPAVTGEGSSAAFGASGASPEAAAPPCLCLFSTQLPGPAPAELPWALRDAGEQLGYPRN